MLALCQEGDCVVALDHCRQLLAQEGFLAVVISDLSDVPSFGQEQEGILSELLSSSGIV